MGREVLTVEFWSGFEKQANLVGQVAARAAGRGQALGRLNKIRKASPDAFKPANLLGQIITNPSKGMANAAARHSSAYNSPKEKLYRTVGKTMLAGAGGAYLVNKMDPDPEAYGRRSS